MAFVDEVTIQARAGKGGDGVVRWLHLKGKKKGGPSGGDGGRGGDVVVVGVRDLAILGRRYRFEKEFVAENGKAGESDLRHGANGADLELPVPLGTTIHISETGMEYEMVEEGQRILLFKGGAGGKGNARFKSSTNQNPWEYTEGRAGQGGKAHLSLRIIADVGFIGLPSAGKSTLLNALTSAKAKTAAYPFTTLEPNLGDFYGYILADIPGLIEGASSGRGLGIKFLKHIERTRILVHLVSVEQEDILAAYREVRAELEAFGHGLAEKPEIIVLAKADLVSPKEAQSFVKKVAAKTGKEVLSVSSTDPKTLKAFSERLTNILRG